MRKIAAYQSFDALSRAIDNGGRWYSLFAKAADGLVTEGELSKAAEAGMNLRDALLFLSIASRKLTKEERARLVAMLELPVRLSHARHLPQELRASAVEANGRGGQAVLIDGVCRERVRKSNLKIPVSVFTKSFFLELPRQTHELTPVTQLCAVFELADAPGDRGPTTLLGVKHGQELPLNTRFCIAGFLQELTFVGGKPSHHFICYGRYYSAVESA